jgi:glycosyltransferase involved in cell wall biosynthesis
MERQCSFGICNVSNYIGLALWETVLPRVSVIMPAYNRAAVIGASIQSVLAQQFEDFELIVVDDGSEDGTADAARGHDDPRVQVIELKRNGGANAARNHGIRKAKSPLIAFLDSDDIYLPEKLSRVVAEFDARPKLDVLVDSFVKLCEPDTKRRQVVRRNPRIDDNQEFVRRLFGRKLWKPTSAITVRRAAAVKAGLFDEKVRRRQDFDFLIRLSAVANCASTDEILWVKCWSSDCISSSNQFMASTLELVRRYPQYLSEPEYRCGLAKDLAIHLLRGLKRRRFLQVRADTRRMIGEFGAARTGALLVEGAREIASRVRKLRRERASAERLSPGLAKARSRASARS